MENLLLKKREATLILETFEELRTYLKANKLEFTTEDKNLIKKLNAFVGPVKPIVKDDF